MDALPHPAPTVQQEHSSQNPQECPAKPPTLPGLNTPQFFTELPFSYSIGPLDTALDLCLLGAFVPVTLCLDHLPCFLAANVTRP